MLPDHPVDEEEARDEILPQRGASPLAMTSPARPPGSMRNPPASSVPMTRPVASGHPDADIDESDCETALVELARMHTAVAVAPRIVSLPLRTSSSVARQPRATRKRGRLRLLASVTSPISEAGHRRPWYSDRRRRRTANAANPSDAPAFDDNTRRRWPCGNWSSI